MLGLGSSKILWCWEGLGAGGEGDDRGWDGWMASLTRWTWVWVNSGSWWWTGRPGVLRFMGLQKVGHDWATELNWSLSSLRALSRLVPPARRLFLPQLLGQLAPSVQPCGFVLLPPCGGKFGPLSSEFPAEWSLDLKARLDSGSAFSVRLLHRWCWTFHVCNRVLNLFITDIFGCAWSSLVRVAFL